MYSNTPVSGWYLFFCNVAASIRKKAINRVVQCSIIALLQDIICLLKMRYLELSVHLNNAIYC